VAKALVRNVLLAATTLPADLAAYLCIVNIHPRLETVAYAATLARMTRGYGA